MSRKPLLPAEAALQERTVAVRVLRMGFLVLIATVVLLYALEVPKTISAGRSGASTWAAWWVPVGFGTLAGAMAFLLDLRTPSKKISTISGLVFGLLAGLLATFALSFVIDLLANTYDLVEKVIDPVTGRTVVDPVTRKELVVQMPFVQAVKVLSGICLIYIAISTVLQTQDNFRLVIPYVEFAKQIRGPKPLLLDTSALIDARIADVASTGFVQTPLVIPSFVLHELQRLADSDDKLKRAKGRRGLDIVARLQRAPGLDVSIDETPVPGKAVDQMLLELARTMPAIIVTADSALLRVAAIQDVRILNLNDLGNALKPALIPGSALGVTIVKRGEQPGQGVGYLDDGTMVVVENAADLVGELVQTEVSSSLQTSAGRLIFARRTGGGPQGEAATAAAASDGTADQPGQDDGAAEEAAAEAEAGEESTADETAASAEDATRIAPPLTVRPPEPGPPGRPGPFPPKRGRGNPLRNPRR